MSSISSKVTAQGQVSVPAEVRRKLGLGPGSVLEWEERGDHAIVRRGGRYTSGDLHSALFPEGPPSPKSIAQLKEGVRAAVAKRHARR
jgi:AbrB family looped-hinge helix DNA binding protein